MCRGAHPARVWRSAARRSRKSPRAAATSTPAACAPQNKSRSTSLSASSQITFARFRSQSLTESFHQTKAAVTFCVAFLRRAVRYGRTLGFHEPFFFKLVDVVAKTMGDVFPEVRTQQSKQSKKRFAAKKNRLTKRSIKGFECFDACTSMRCRSDAAKVNVACLTRSRQVRHLGWNCRALQALRHLRLSARSHRTHGARARAHCGCCRVRKVDGGTARRGRERRRRRRKSVLKKASSKSSRPNFLDTIFSRRNQLSKPFCRAKNRTR